MSHLPSAMLIVLKKIWSHNVNIELGGGENRHFDQLLR